MLSDAQHVVTKVGNQLALEIEKRLRIARQAETRALIYASVRVLPRPQEQWLLEHELTDGRILHVDKRKEIIGERNRSLQSWE
jgi:hypothetical protein